ncbi:MAG TPA: plastocyanin/azurin family copper-binding protein [Mycobacteriales bacterium]|jgi:plastocyanin|nr:plastocyanin/azurin family copper-binding protein [Mycobacteriales bacterium]
MRPGLRVARAVLALGGAAALVWPGAAAHAKTVGVQTTMDNTFQPAKVTIDRGDSVLWTNNGGLNHTVTSTSKNWSKNDSITIVGQSTSYEFDTAGTYTYQCNTHPATMKGTVVVRAPAKPKPPPTTATTRPPTPTRTTSAPPTTRPTTAPPSATPSPSVSSGTSVIPSGTVPPPASTTPPPPPVVVGEPTPSSTVYLGTGGLRPPPATGRGKGLPVMLALLLVGGVGSAEVRALLANAPE